MLQEGKEGEAVLNRYQKLRVRNTEVAADFSSKKFVMASAFTK